MILRRHVIFGLGITGILGGSAASMFAGSAVEAQQSNRPLFKAEDWAVKLVEAAESQVGLTTVYDPAYKRLAYPLGDVPMQRGVCTDVVIRAYRAAFGIDLQKLVHEDMKSAFGGYPAIWGLKRPDRNIDHRRVPNLEHFLKRRGADLPVTKDGADYQPGDLVTQRLPGNLPHIAIVTNRPAKGRNHALVVHNIGAGTQIEDRLFEFRISGHFRLEPTTG
ncbi:DUF1287 domain-containing protein [Anderseniella sp. Alg231-50]|uniref:DUF1287 domain-containing protein n=1 Tax=Anderseniella sp. Alg231-50 TaxID=1922226 RepID=UPI00307B77AC